MTDIFATIKALTGLQDDMKVLSLQHRAEDQLRTYLRYDEWESLYRFSSSIVDLAIALNDLEKLSQKVNDSLGLRSESYAEGSVSVRKDYGSLSDVSETYKTKVDAIFEYLKPYRRGHVITKAKNANAR